MPRKSKKQKELITESPIEETVEVSSQPAEVEYVTEEPVKKPKRKYVRKKKVVIDETLASIPETVAPVAPVAPVETVVPVVKVKKVRKPRKPSAYNSYVASAMRTDAIKRLPPKLRFAAISKKWSAHKAQNLVKVSA